MSADENRFTIPLETRQRLSASLIWQAQRNYFERAGIDAWRSGTVPHYVTNNPRLAAAYAAVVLGFLRDVCDGPGRATLLRQPLHIVELGAGCGRFAFFFLQIFSEMLAGSGLAQIPFRYVITDFTESNLAFLRGHEALKPFIERGVLDFARFDVEKDHAIMPELSGETLGASGLKSPLVVIANYVFDGVSQDAFVVREGGLFEQLISVFSDVPSPDLAAHDTFEHLAVSYEERPAEQPYYPEPEFNAILDGTTGEAKMTDTPLLFPCTALRCAQRLGAISKGGMLLLTGDKGGSGQDFLDGSADPAFAMHGSFSMNVNYHAMSEYFVRAAGKALTPGDRCAGLYSYAFLTGPAGETHCETRLAWKQAIGGGAAADFFVLRRGLQKDYERLELKHLLALLRLSGFDPKIMRDCLPVMQAQTEAAWSRKDEVTEAALQVWKNYFHLGEQPDLLFELGGLLYGLGEYEHALHLLQDSRRLYGDDPNTLWNTGLCHCGLRNTEAAVECFTRAMNTEGEFRPQGGLKEKSAP